MPDREKTFAPEYRIVKDAQIEKHFAYHVEKDEDGFWYDDENCLLGAVVQFKEYPDHEMLTETYQDLLVKGVMQMKEVDADEARDYIDECEDESDFGEELDLSTTFSLLFIVDGHSGMYRMLLDANDYWVGHSSGLRKDRWEI